MDKKTLMLNAQAGPGCPAYIIGTRSGLIHLRSLIESALENFHGGAIGINQQADGGEYPIIVAITSDEEAKKLPKPYVLEHERGTAKMTCEDAAAVRATLEAES